MPDVEGYALNEEDTARQLDRLHAVRAERSNEDVVQTLGTLRRASREEMTNLMPLLIDCAHACCTVGEITDVLRDSWGTFQQPGVF